MSLSELTQIALLGTERQSPRAPAPNTDLGQLQAQLDPERRERSLLSLAALSGLHERIGQLPARDNAPAPAPCPIETRLRVGDLAGSLLLRLLGGENAQLLPEWLALATQARQIAQPESLPSLLSTGASKPELRGAIAPVLGERGQWLAAQSPEWAWVNGAAGEDVEIWHTGERSARVLFLQRLRRADPDRARELLAATWPEETPDDRKVVLGLLEIGLAPADEPFLEAALDDKRKEVRHQAAALLGRLPGSALVQRMTERALPLLRFIPGEPGNLIKLKKARSASVEITLPAVCDKAMLRDGVGPKRPPNFGEKTWWLIQMLQVVPLDVWVREWKAAPADILAGSLHGHWQKELFEAWSGAAIRQQNAEWVDAVFASAVERKRVDLFDGLLRALPTPLREARLSALLAASEAKTLDLHGALVTRCRHDWSEGFSRTVLTWLRRTTTEPSADWQLRNQLKDLALHLAPAVLGETSTGWPTDAAGWEFWSKGVDELLAVAQFRADLHTVFAHPSIDSPTHDQA